MSDMVFFRKKKAVFSHQAKNKRGSVSRESAVASGKFLFANNTEKTEDTEETENAELSDS